tara:strand:- start:85 stop:432 length:348 start_codon:yes stop_codon:yes gene_type:complete
MNAQIREQREKKFIKFMAHTDNATQSAINSGYRPETARQQGYRLKQKYHTEIIERREHDFLPLIGLAINTLISLLDSKSARVRFDVACYILKLNGYGQKMEQKIQEQQYNKIYGE